MKKSCLVLLIFSAVLCFTSCEKEEFPREYCIESKLSFDIDKLYVSEYNEQGDRLYDRIINNFYAGSSYSFTAFNNEITKVKIYIKDFNKWIQRVYYLNENGTTKIQIVDDVLVGYDEP